MTWAERARIRVWGPAQAPLPGFPVRLAYGLLTQALRAHAQSQSTCYGARPSLPSGCSSLDLTYSLPVCTDPMDNME